MEIAVIEPDLDRGYPPLSLMEYADRALISEMHSKCETLIRVSWSRSDLSRHHVMIARAIGRFSSEVRRRCIATPCSSRSRSVIGLVVPAVRQQRPGDSCILVGERHSSHVLVSPAHDPGQPTAGMLRFPFGHPNHRSRPVNQQVAQIGVAPLADAEQRLLAAAGMLPRHQSQPSRQLPAILCSPPRLTLGRFQARYGSSADSRRPDGYCDGGGPFFA